MFGSLGAILLQPRILVLASMSAPASAQIESVNPANNYYFPMAKYRYLPRIFRAWIAVDILTAVRSLCTMLNQSPHSGLFHAPCRAAWPAAPAHSGRPCENSPASGWPCCTVPWITLEPRCARTTQSTACTQPPHRHFHPIETDLQEVAER